MEVIELSGIECRRRFPQCNYLGELILGIEKDYMIKDKVVCKIKVNGFELSEVDEEKFDKMLASEINHLYFEIDSVQDVIQKTLHSLNFLLPKIEKHSLLSSEIFRSQSAGAIKNLVDLLDSIRYVTESFQHLLTVGESRDYIWSSHQLWQEIENKAILTIKELLQAFEKKDDLQIADILEYEISELVSKWQQLLSMISQTTHS